MGTARTGTGASRERQAAPAGDREPSQAGASGVAVQRAGSAVGGKGQLAPAHRRPRRRSLPGHRAGPNAHICPSPKSGANSSLQMDIWQNVGRPISSCCRSRKSNDPENLAKVDLRTSLLLRRFSAPLRRSVIDFR
jgi:hypothetical protein